MKSIRIKCLSIILLLAAASVTQAQDLHFSQFYETSILRNPALTGLFSDDYKVTAVYRNQWSSISKPFQTALISAETRIPVRGEANDFVSVGLLGYYDKAGSLSLQTATVYPALNYNKCLNNEQNTYLSVGFTGGFIQRSFDPSKATFDNQFQNGRYDPAYSTGETIPNPSFTQWDMGAGVNFNGTGGKDNNINYMIGVSGYHFSQPRYSFADRNIHIGVRWNANAAISVQANPTFSYQLHANYAKQGSYNEVVFGGLIGWNLTSAGAYDAAFSIMGGIFYRLNDALIPTLKLRYKDLSVGVSYDTNMSGLSSASRLRGGTEITLVKTGLFKDPKFDKSRTLCPHFY